MSNHGTYAMYAVELKFEGLEFADTNVYGPFPHVPAAEQWAREELDNVDDCTWEVIPLLSPIDVLYDRIYG